ncbi:predicted protein [Histoplasma mississippiense (nom. inval.)]|uniref:predicted protein n=1 Tax=Ajellomyces capsulatus (strain NAm1 / WU24) TaxID=2059318 RepID=UPI000157D459|nr:predicted protein [Histoplasma mississippiense (nom. inval.)]EDN05074.1 predicted protein [Histoplasma mississippiense (nom. inval.)]
MPRNTHRSTASQARKRTPTTLRLRLSKPPVPDVPDNDENPTDDEKEDKEGEEEEEETQSEDPRFLRTPTPEPEISFRLYERVIINGIKEPIKIKLRNVTTNDMTVSFYPFIGVSDSQLTTQALASKRALDVKEEVISPPAKSPLYRPAKSP